MSETLAQRITAAFEAESANPKVPQTRADIPFSYDLITNAWLTDILCHQTPGAEVTGHQLGPPDEGTNNRRRIHLSYDAAGKAAGLPASVFCKATQGLNNRMMLGHSGGVLCEVTFWNHARDLLDIEAPVALHANYDPVGFGSIVVFEDFGDDAQFCSEATQVDRNFAEQQIAILAKLHGRFNRAPELQGGLAVLPTWKQRFNNLATFHLEESCAAGMQAAEAFVPPRLFARRSEIWPATMRSLDCLDRLPKTLCHGDVHLKNWYVRGANTVGLGDWGVTHIGHWARDLVYTLATSLTVADRRAWEDDLIRLYLDQFRAAGGDAVSFDDAMRTYRQSLPTALAFWTLTLKPTPDFPDMQPPATAKVFIERLATAMDDLDGLEFFRV